MAWIWKNFFQVFNLSLKVNDEPDQTGTQILFLFSVHEEKQCQGPFHWLLKTAKGLQLFS